MKKISVAAVCLLGLLIGCSKTDVSGMWKGALTAKSGVPLAIEVMLNQDGKHLSGNLTNKKLGAQLILTGSVDGDKLSFNTNYDRGLYISFVGSVEKTTIKGDAEVTMRGPGIPGGGTTETMALVLAKNYEAINSGQSDAATTSETGQDEARQPETMPGDPDATTNEDEVEAIRTQVKDGLDYTAAARVSVSEIYIDKGGWPSSNDAVGLPTPFTSGAFTLSVAAGGIITVIYTEPHYLAGKSLVLTPSAEDRRVNWSCKSADIEDKYLPQMCQ